MPHKNGYEMSIEITKMIKHFNFQSAKIIALSSD